MEEHPKLFISYSQDNPEHKNWVLKLATDLRQDMGVNVILDQWDLRIGNDLSLFMEQGLNGVSLVLCICSDEYVRKSNAGICGAGYEKMILTQSLLKDTNIDYIIPVIRSNSGKRLPSFLGTKLYVDFSDDGSYTEKLRELTDRIYNEDVAKKPQLGENPYSKKEANLITVKMNIESALNHSVPMTGQVSFDFMNNSGQYIVGTGDYEFKTCWSECGNNSIYGYRDYVKLIGYLYDVVDIPPYDELSKFDFSSRVREVNVGEILVWMNHNGKFMVTKITNVEVRSRGATQNNLSFDYYIYCN